MLVTMKEILDPASAGNYAVAAPNLWTELDARAVIDAAQELRAPLILDIAYPANPDLFLLCQIARYFAQRATVPVAINLDHGGSKKEVLEAFRAGFTSVMIDRSACPFEQNVREVKEIVELAHALGISVEAELGHVGMADQYETDGSAALTEPETAAEFIRLTGVDCLAVAVGTAHGAYPKGMKPKLDFERLAAIKEKTGHFPLVMHGSSGTDNETLRKACRMGINKVNIANDLCQAAAKAAKTADLEGNHAYDFSAVVYEAVKAKMKEMIEVYGSVGKASM
ncbi:class II fructose-bisphosphate aldolase [Holdemania filiformis]|uniref:class II fructose-bisphosphate aldolase n=1 Tax=Holdemania filiformis TaxID=61171 RepID=UPI00266F62BE|nr:class II fructose-bisphosphate aldolase [Holdemania filiformis]